jgi:predicted ATPase
MGSTLQKMGRCLEALDHLNHASRISSENQSQLYSLTVGHDFKAPSECCAGAALWALGFPDSALRQMQQGLAYARKLPHAQSLVAANHYAAQLHLFRGEPEAAKLRAEELLDLTHQHGFGPWLAFGNIYLGSAESKLGAVGQGIDHMKEGITAYSEKGGKLWSPYFIGLLADALGKSDRADEGLVWIDQAINTAESNEELFAIADLYRIKGELTIRISSAAETSRTEARSYFAKALEIARSQNLRSWELRTLLSIHRHNLGPSIEASDIKTCYRSFTEGFETEDLQKASVHVTM